MLAQHATLADPQHLAVAARVHVEEEGAEADVRLDLDPDALVGRLGHDDLGLHAEMAHHGRVVEHVLGLRWNPADHAGGVDLYVGEVVGFGHQTSPC